MINDIKINDKIGEKFVVKAVFGGEGKSGMGVIYICLNIDNGNLYAFKTFQDQFIYSEEIKKRFKQEALAWIHLEKHVNIVTAYSFDIINSRPFILIELIVPDNKGRNTLEHYIKTDIAESQIVEMIFQQLFPEFKRCKEITYIKPLFLEVQILDWAIQFCHGMEHAIFRGVSPHRDIKPDNIMITEDKILKITDFGLAKIWDEINDLSQFRDLSEDIISFLHTDSTKQSSGTPEYMAPEQFEGNANEISDLYSFGIVLYQMINRGIPPFIVDGDDKDWHHKLYLAHKKDKVQEIKSDIFPIIQKCLEKKPDDRYQSFGELRKDLEKLYKKMTGNDPPKPPKDMELEAGEHVNKGYAFKKLGFTKDSISELQTAISLDPKLYQAHMNLGITFIEAKQYDRAIMEFKEVIKINPNHAEAHYNLANILFKIGELDDVIYHYKEAIRLNPNCKQAHVNMGNILKDMGLVNESISEYKKALIVDPGFFKAIMNLGNALENKGLHEDAIALYEQAYKIKPNDSCLHNNWGIALSNNGDESEAIKRYIKAITLNPEYSEAHYNLGLVFVAQGKTDIAMHEFNEAIKYDSHNAGAHNSLGIILAQSEQYNNAISEFERSLEINSENIIAQENLIMARLQYGHVLLNQGQYIEASKQYKQIIKIEPDNVNAHDNLGVTYFHLDQIDDAIYEFKEVLRVDPRNENAKTNLKRSNDYKENFLNTA